MLNGQAGRPRVSALLLRSAYQCCLTLGIAVRAERLAEAHPWLLSRDLMSAGSAGIDPVSAPQVVHALPTARTLGGLAEILLGTVADTTGAARVLLLTGEGEQLTVRAVWEHGVTPTVEDPWNEVSHDCSIVGRVADSGRPHVVAADPAYSGHRPPGRDKRHAAVPAP